MKQITFVQRKKDETVLLELDFLLPNIFIGMILWIEGIQYVVKDVEYDFPTFNLSRLFIIVE